MEVILDTNFIISCVKKKIDFVMDLEDQGFSVVVPREVIQELKDLRLNVGHAERIAIGIALERFASEKIGKLRLGGNSVDSGLIAKGKQGIYIATLDAAVKRAVPNKVVISEAKNSIVLERS